jgi:hypothetical protein
MTVTKDNMFLKVQYSYDSAFIVPVNKVKGLHEFLNSGTFYKNKYDDKTSKRYWEPRTEDTNVAISLISKEEIAGWEVDAALLKEEENAD